MATVTLKNLPLEVHRQLKSRAARHGRSLNSEVIECLRAVVAADAVDVDALLVRARAHRASVGAALDDAEVRALKRAGRR